MRFPISIIITEFGQLQRSYDYQRYKKFNANQTIKNVRYRDYVSGEFFHRNAFVGVPKYRGGCNYRVEEKEVDEVGVLVGDSTPRLFAR